MYHLGPKITEGFDKLRKVVHGSYRLGGVLLDLNRPRNLVLTAWISRHLKILISVLVVTLHSEVTPHAQSQVLKAWMVSRVVRIDQPYRNPETWIE